MTQSDASLPLRARLRARGVQVLTTGLGVALAAGAALTPAMALAEGRTDSFDRTAQAVSHAVDDAPVLVAEASHDRAGKAQDIGDALARVPDGKLLSVKETFRGFLAHLDDKGRRVVAKHEAMLMGTLREEIAAGRVTAYAPGGRLPAFVSDERLTLAQALAAPGELYVTAKDFKELADEKGLAGTRSGPLHWLVGDMYTPVARAVASAPDHAPKLTSGTVTPVGAAAPLPAPRTPAPRTPAPRTPGR